MYRIGEEEIEAVARVIAGRRLFRSGDSTNGNQHAVDTFERQWAATIGAEYALCLSGGGTAAMVCALAALGIGPGDEVIVPAYTWMATATAVLNVGAIPVIAEIDETITLDPLDVERKLSRHTRAILPVHMAGRPANLQDLLAIARRENLFLIEDCAQAAGGTYRGKPLGSHGQVGCFSFNDAKILSCGEGGALVTNDRQVFDRARVFHDSLVSFPTFAQDLTVDPFVGMQFRASEIMGAILGVQLTRLEGILSDLRRIGATFDSELSGLIDPTPSNDPEGDCRVVVAYQFADESSARAFATAEGVGGFLPMDTGRHIFANWDALMHRRTSHHPDWDPLTHPKNIGLQSDYAPDMCPHTIRELSRTVFISINPDWTESDVKQRISACRRATGENENQYPR
jgi:dTDP-4-amino-4,6-dideoxygalactose transaminase